MHHPSRAQSVRHHRRPQSEHHPTSLNRRTTPPGFNTGTHRLNTSQAFRKRSASILQEQHDKLACMILKSGASLPSRLLDATLELIWPTRCVGCEQPDVLLCADCEEALPHIDFNKACPRCGAPFGSIICTECYSRLGPVPFSFAATRCAFSFEGTAGRLVVVYKDQGERRLAVLLAGYLSSALPPEWIQWADALTFIPADAHALRRRGFDHMEQIAVHVADMTGLSLVRLLGKNQAEDQRSLGRHARHENLSEAFYVQALGFPPSRDPCKKLWPRPSWHRHYVESSSSCDLPEGVLQTAQVSCVPEKLLIIDDVFTTGATLNAASMALISAGAREVRAATVARVW